MNITTLDWNKFGTLTLNLSRKVRDSFNVDAIIGIGKSGLIPAAILAKKLDIGECYSVAVTLYDEGKPPKRVFDRPKVSYSNVRELVAKNVLIVDDFVHTGSTLRKVIEVVRGKGAREIRSAVIALREDAEFEPDYYAVMFEGCVAFPWDVE